MQDKWPDAGPGPRPQVDVVDMSWVGVAPARLAVAFAERRNWRRWWPDLTLEVTADRGPLGMQWAVPHGHDASVTGSMEIWLKDVDDGTVVHYFLRLDATSGTLDARTCRRFEHSYRTRMKRIAWALSDRLDPGRLHRLAAPGSAPATSSAPRAAG